MRTALFFAGYLCCLPALSSATEPGPILSATNLAGPAMTYDGIAFAADDGSATGNTGTEGANNSGPNGLQEGLLDTPFASMRWGREVTWSGPVPDTPVTVDLYFMEGWWPDAGRRVMAIEVEGEVLRSGFDVLAASGGDPNVPQIVRLTGIDPARSGDPNRLDLRILTEVDNAILSAVVLRCDGDAATCAARAEAAEAERIAAAAAAEEAERLRWQGVWELPYQDQQRRSYRHVFTSTGKGAILYLRSSTLGCDAAFGPAPHPSQMPLLGFSCIGMSEASLGDPRLDEGPDGAIRFAMAINGRDWGFDIPKLVSMPLVPSTIPDDFPFETAGLTLAKTWSEQQAQVAARLADLGQPATEWTTEDKGNDIYYHTIGVPDRFADDEGEHYLAYTVGNGPDARPIALLRRWIPAADQQPLYDTTMAALREKYGPERSPVIAVQGGSTRIPIGVDWAMAPDGSRHTEACDGPLAAQVSLPALKGQVYRFPGAQIGRPLSTGIAWRHGCGLYFQVTHNVLQDGPAIEAMQFMLADNAPLTEAVWEFETRDWDARVAEILSKSAVRTETEDAQQAIKPEL